MWTQCSAICCQAGKDQGYKQNRGYVGEPRQDVSILRRHSRQRGQQGNNAADAKLPQSAGKRIIGEGPSHSSREEDPGADTGDKTDTHKARITSLRLAKSKNSDDYDE